MVEPSLPIAVIFIIFLSGSILIKSFPLIIVHSNLELSTFKEVSDAAFLISTHNSRLSPSFIL